MLKTKRTTKRTTKTATYRVLKGFSYPATLAVRERGVSHTPKSEQGEWVRHEAGDKIAAPPADVLKNLLMRGVVELIEQKGASS